MPNTPGTSNMFDQLFYLDSYLRILDFSRPADSTKNSIDITTDNITRAIRLPDTIPRLEGAVLLISDGVMHMLPGRNIHLNITDTDGNILNTATYGTNLAGKVWDFDLTSQKWGVQVSGIGDQAKDVAVAFDAEKQVGWYYGGVDIIYNGTSFVDPSLNRSLGAFQDLHRLDKGKVTPVKVEADNSFIGSVDMAELVYIGGAGEAGILVLIGGNGNTQITQLVSIVD